MKTKYQNQYIFDEMTFYRCFKRFIYIKRSKYQLLYRCLNKRPRTRTKQKNCTWTTSIHLAFFDWWMAGPWKVTPYTYWKPLNMDVYMQISNLFNPNCASVALKFFYIFCLSHSLLYSHHLNCELLVSQVTIIRSQLQRDK